MTRSDDPIGVQFETPIAFVLGGVPKKDAQGRSGGLSLCGVVDDKLGYMHNQKHVNECKKGGFQKKQRTEFGSLEF
jgi:hypothetical protein